jgi:WD40 repeat protein
VAWDARSGRQLFIRAAGVHATAMDIAPDSRLLGVGTEDGHVLLLDTRTGRQSQPPIQAAAANIAQVAYSPDGRSFAAAAVDGTTSLWDLRSRKRVGNPFPPSPGTIPELAFEANGRLLIGGLSNAVEWPTDVRNWERFACDAAGRDLTRAEWHDLVPNRDYRPACPA